MSSIRRALKRGLDMGCLALVCPCAALCALEARLSDRAEAMFTFWAQTFALVPGLPGVFFRRAFYRLTLDRCARSFFIGFGALFSHRHASVEEDVYVGPYAIIGSSWLHHGCLIGTRTSIVSGGELHTLDSNLRWTPADLGRLRRIDIGEYAWIGEGSLIVADIGAFAMVAAGSVVSSAVPAGIVVAGNPARFVRRLTVEASEEEVQPVTATALVR